MGGVDSRALVLDYALLRQEPKQPDFLAAQELPKNNDFYFITHKLT